MAGIVPPLQRDPGGLAQGFVDFDLGSSPGWWAATIATYCPSRPGELELPKFLFGMTGMTGILLTCFRARMSARHCHDCGADLDSAEALIKHVMAAHAKAAADGAASAACHRCPSCPSEFTTAANLARHSRAEHQGPDAIENNCGLSFSWKNGLSFELRNT